MTGIEGIVFRGSDVAKLTGGMLVGMDRVISRPCTLRNPREGGLAFAKTQAHISTLPAEFSGSLTIIAPPEMSHEGFGNVSLVLVESPRYAFAKAIAEFFTSAPSPTIASTARISPESRVGAGTRIGEYAVVGRNCRIGKGTFISNHVVIADNVVVGDRCVIKSGSVVGEAGFGIVKDSAGNNYRMPHIGGVVIGDDVEIGSLSTICAGTIDPTIIDDFVKIDDHVHVGHNCLIRKNCIVTAGSIIGGSAVIHEDVWLGLNCAVMNGVEVGRGALVGLGAALLAGCEANVTLSAYPARQLPKKS